MIETEEHLTWHTTAKELRALAKQLDSAVEGKTVITIREESINKVLHIKKR